MSRYPIHQDWCHVSHDGPCLREDQPAPTTAAAAEPPHGWTARETSMWIRICELTEDLLAARREERALRDALQDIGEATVTHDPEPFRNRVIAILAALAATPEEK